MLKSVDRKMLMYVFLMLLIFSLSWSFVLFAISIERSGADAIIPAIVGGSDQTIALKPGGNIWAWGENDNGEVGNGSSETNVLLPVQVLTEGVSIAAGDDHSLAIRSDGTVWTWGANNDGQLGINDNDAPNKNMAVQVKGSNGAGVLSDITGISGGEDHSLALKSDGTVWAWGEDLHGQVGDNDVKGADKFYPVQVVGADSVGSLTEIISIAAGKDHSLALKTDGTVWAWGLDSEGQLGDNDGTAEDKFAPVQVKGSGGNGFLTDVVSIAAGEDHSLALKSDGTVWSWGENDDGQLGDNDDTKADKPTPVQVKDSEGTGNLTNVAAIAGGKDHSLAMMDDGSVWAWGEDTDGQLGDNDSASSKPDKLTPVQVRDSSGSGFFDKAVAISAGKDHSLALRSDGSAWAWGENSNGQLGNNDTTGSDQIVPVKVSEPGADDVTDKPDDDAGNIPVIDTTAPNILQGVSTQGKGRYVRGTINLRAKATDDYGVSNVNYFLDATSNLIGSSGVNPYSVDWNTKSTSNGKHNILTYAYDAARNNSNVSTQLNVDNYRPRTYGKRTRVRRLNKKKAPRYLKLYRYYRAKQLKSKNRVLRRRYAKAKNKYLRAYRDAKKRMATARLKWKVRDPYTGNKSIVKIKIQKRIKSKARTKRKARYLKQYRAWRAKYLKTKNRRLRARYKKQTNKYLRAYRKTKTVIYKTVKNISYGLTGINKWRSYRYRTNKAGQYKYLVYAIDRAGNKQKNVARGSLRIK